MKADARPDLDHAAIAAHDWWAQYSHMSKAERLGEELVVWRREGEGSGPIASPDPLTRPPLHAEFFFSGLIFYGINRK